MSLLSVLALGFFLGVRHATDADHVVAVTTIVSRERSRRAAAVVGAFWGLGHSVTLFVVGGTLLVFRFTIPPRVGLSMEMAVAVMLVVLGMMNLTEVLRRIERTTKSRIARNDGIEVDSASVRHRSGRIIRPLVVGVVHGLAGSAAVALLVLTTIRDIASSMGYLLVFGLGTVAGMILLTVTMAMPLALATERFASVERVMARATGLLSLAFGAYLIYRIGIVDGLFSAHPRWAPE